MGHQSTNDLLDQLDKLLDVYDFSNSTRTSLLGCVKLIYQSDLEETYSKPMLWIGLYIALASLVCILAMVADLLHGLRSRQLWFPCKYFRINAAFLTLISIAMKLPVDLSGSMPGVVDQTAKLGSMAFMCTMMANLLPCLATMNNDELLSNITALCVLVITLVVNVCIQIQTGVLDSLSAIVAIMYVTWLLELLLLHLCSSLAILKSKQIIESKYQKRHDAASEDIQQSSGRLLTVEKLQKHVRNHWIMAASGSPQFITACSPAASASGVICALITGLHALTMLVGIMGMKEKDYQSVYKWSMMVILIVQSIGVVIGAIAPLSRCFATLSFKVSSKIILNHFKVFKVESYWTWKLYDWKHGGIHEFRSRNLEVIIETMKKLILSLCIKFQKGVVVMCKITALAPFLFMICVLYCFRCMKWLLKAMFTSLGKKFEKLERNNDLRPYVLQLDDDIELAERTLVGLIKYVNQFMQKGAKSSPDNLMKLLRKSTRDFQGVQKFDHIDHDVPSKVDYQDCWRLPVVTLTAIAVSLPAIEKEEVDSLLESVREGLVYVTIVEKGLNATDNHVSAQKATETLWREIRLGKKWLGNELQDPSLQMNAAGQIVEWLRDRAKNMAFTKETSKNNIGGPNDDPITRSICAYSMYRITETLLLAYHTNNDATVSQKELFDTLSSMIADIIAACLTNLPQVIRMKCHTCAIEEREASVKDAAQLLGETTQIIEILQDHYIPNMDPSDMPYIDKWRSYLSNP
ncbi:hypothetical protein HanPI659440_Chr10g0397891 [Helianthus annuus]|nr:hypothetical protein HanPI659440_Chr10g0397891 [Helianthus annuus]